jgi:hypothetical protein
MKLSKSSGETAIRFHTEPLTDTEANQLHEELGTVVAVRDVLLGGQSGAGWVGAIAPVDTTEDALLALMDRLRADPRIQALTVAVGRFPATHVPPESARPATEASAPATEMNSIIKKAQLRHTFRATDTTGWIPPHHPQRVVPERTVDLVVQIERVEGGFVLRWIAPQQEDSGEHWYIGLAYAEHAAEELFGISSSQWDP